MKIDRKNDLNLRLLEIFGAAMLHRSTVDAAAELGISQPAVSNAIKNLEQRLGFLLFERTSRGLNPTDEARLLYEEVAPVNSMVRRIEQQVRDLKTTREGLLRIAATPPLGHSIIPVALKRFLTDRPNVRINYQVNRFDIVLQQVESGASDIGLLLGLRQHPGCEAITLHEGVMECLVPTGHPLAAHEAITPEDIAEHGVIGLEASSRLGSLVRGVFVRSDVPYRANIEVHYCHSAGILADAGLGVAIVDPFTAHFARWDDVVRRPFRPEIAVSTAAIVRQSTGLSRVAAAFIEDVRGLVGELS